MKTKSRKGRRQDKVVPKITTKPRQRQGEDKDSKIDKSRTSQRQDKQDKQDKQDMDNDSDNKNDKLQRQR